MGAARVCLIVLAAGRVATVSATFCQSMLYTDSFVCDDGSDVGSNGCCASTDSCPSSCMSWGTGWGSGGKTCTCNDCNYGFKLTSLTEDDRFLKAHNYFRCRHGQNLLAWDSTTAASAATWSDTCPSQGSNSAHIRPDGTSAYDLDPSCGENVAAGYQSIEAAVEAWYSEITNPGYTPGTANQPPSGTGHYTALIWAATTKLGCAVNACASGSPAPVYVCHYSEAAPNFGFDSDYFDNVPQSNTETATEDYCCTAVYGSDGDDPDPSASFATASVAPWFMLWFCVASISRS
ncbi:unnamed protein product [Prorocentrum cordatum]|uniref:SCP domain-containing protein n=1 Tax=Prorocentrum cordatum TaxID=2364126 RepID=A0ABN9U3G5_9DINO|nr:unnamed protein product [Polarella glacialis]|mmetsp:Transcript_83791/g.237256  ORF Transcript_83791/g.237256 Transcript_83791/m.237256 type:complete len:291 (-) Transcript_83791:134-1006(-)